jgi:hypothetical protein
VFSVASVVKAFHHGGHRGTEKAESRKQKVETGKLFLNPESCFAAPQAANALPES